MTGEALTDGGESSSAGPLTEKQIDGFAAAWYRALDFHFPLEEIARLLTDRDLRMEFPDGDIHDFAGFKQWYDRVINLFFDENHYVKTLKATISGDQATVDIVVGWQASWWEPPAAKSKRVSMDATQRWTVRASTKKRLRVGDR